MIKIQIKTIWGSVLFEHESPTNTIKETVRELLKKFRSEDKIIEGANLSNYDLSGMKFDNSTFDNSTFDNSTFYNSTFDNSTFDNSKFDNSTILNIRAAGQLKMFNIFKHDLWAVPLMAQHEIPGLLLALEEGRVNGSIYEGDCACLLGTIANVRHVKYNQLECLKPDADRPAERWFMMIKEGDIPDTSEIVKLTMEWIEEFQFHLRPPITPSE